MYESNLPEWKGKMKKSICSFFFFFSKRPFLCRSTGKAHTGKTDAVDQCGWLYAASTANFVLTQGTMKQRRSEYPQTLESLCATYHLLNVQYGTS